MKFFKVCGVVLGILMICAGIFCINNPFSASLAVGYIAGVGILLNAIGCIIAWFALRKIGHAGGWILVGGIISAICGIMLIVDIRMQLFFDLFYAYIFAGWIIVDAIIMIVLALKKRKTHKANAEGSIIKNWWLALIFGILMLIVGILGLSNIAIIMKSIGTLIGMGVIFAGVDLITVAALPAVEKN